MCSTPPLEARQRRESRGGGGPPEGDPGRAVRRTTGSLSGARRQLAVPVGLVHLLFGHASRRAKPVDDLFRGEVRHGVGERRFFLGVMLGMADRRDEMLRDGLRYS